MWTLRCLPTLGLPPSGPLAASGPSLAVAPTLCHAAWTLGLACCCPLFLSPAAAPCLLGLRPSVSISSFLLPGTFQSCPDYDLCQRLSGQRQLYTTGQVFQRDEWDPDIIEKRRKKKKESNKAGEEEEEAEEEEEEEETAEAVADQLMLTEILPHLVQRPEDFLENVQRKIEMYRDTELRPLEELMADQDSQYLIELDGNKSPDELFTSVIARLQSMGLRNGAVITRLQSAEEEMLEGLENDEIFRALAAYKLVAPRYRWRRSKWGRICPVTLNDGEIVMGSPDLAVSFLGKMYTLSSEEALKTFMLNPRPFLLLPMPLPPCKVLVIGPPLSGKSALCAAVASHYTGKVLDMDVLLKEHLEEARLALIEQIRTEATAVGIAKVKEKIEMERLFREQAALSAQEASSDKELEDFEESFHADEKSISEQPSASASRSQRAEHNLQCSPVQTYSNLNPVKLMDLDRSDSA
ncbi:UNVERIFIED_CONTAM: hypothetical protein K2H54_069249 [Gekko kuhli]